MSLSIKAQLLVQLANALPIDPALFKDPSSEWTANQVSSNINALLYYSMLLQHADVSLDLCGTVMLDRPVPNEDIEFLTSLLQEDLADEATLSPGYPPKTRIMIH